MPSISYNLNIPAAGNAPANDQPLMQTNTNAVSTFVSVDHFGFTNASAGSHKQVTLTNQAAPGLGLGNGVLYANASGGQSWPFWQNALGSVLLVSGVPSAGNNGYVYLPGGLIVQWGQVTSTASTFQTLTFSSSNIAFPNNCYAVFTQPYGSGSVPGSQATVEIQKSSVSNTSFKWVFVTNSGAYTGFYWVAIGN